MNRRLFTKPTLLQRITGSPLFSTAMVFLVMFALIGVAEILCTLAGAAFDVRIG